MYPLLFELLSGKDAWRIESFIDKMKDFKKQCTTNEEENFIRSVIYAAEQVKSETN